MKYRAFANGKEISEFPINGVNTDEIWGGDTLLWKKGEEPSENGFRLNIVDALTYFVPPSSFHIAYRQILLYSYDIELNLNKDNIEFGIYGKEEKTTSGSNKVYSSYVYLLCKSKSEEIKKNIDKIFFYTMEFDGQESDLPIGGPYVNPEAYKKVNAKIVYSDNVFSLSNYSERNGIRLFNEHQYSTSIGGYNPGIGSSVTGLTDPLPVLNKFDTKEELLAWAVS